MCFIIKDLLSILKLSADAWTRLTTSSCGEALRHLLKQILLHLHNINPIKCTAEHPPQRSRFSFSCKATLIHVHHILYFSLFFHSRSLSVAPPLSSFYPDYLTILRCHLVRLVCRNTISVIEKDSSFCLSFLLPPVSHVICDLFPLLMFEMFPRYYCSLNHRMWSVS